MSSPSGRLKGTRKPIGTTRSHWLPRGVDSTFSASTTSPKRTPRPCEIWSRKSGVRRYITPGSARQRNRRKSLAGMSDGRSKVDTAPRTRTAIRLCGGTVDHFTVPEAVLCLSRTNRLTATGGEDTLKEDQPTLLFTATRASYALSCWRPATMHIFLSTEKAPQELSAGLSCPVAGLTACQCCLPDSLKITATWETPNDRDADQCTRRVSFTASTIGSRGTLGRATCANSSVTDCC
mmetsp:Transcript_698/g.1621  ORF Transcript_698/g.1621 Transcript_698/m.1621 type:complete len:236 (-) Transcript_698:127-834(-)